jgi:hypothetical protein
VACTIGIREEGRRRRKEFRFLEGLDVQKVHVTVRAVEAPLNFLKKDLHFEIEVIICNSRTLPRSDGATAPRSKFGACVHDRSVYRLTDGWMDGSRSKLARTIPLPWRRPRRVTVQYNLQRIICSIDRVYI